MHMQKSNFPNNTAVMFGERAQHYRVIPFLFYV